MSIGKYHQIINHSDNIDITYQDSRIETYHRLAYLCCVEDESDIADIDKIFNFISENYSFFSQLTEKKQLASWIDQHVFFLANSKSEIDYPDVLTLDDYKVLIVKNELCDGIDYDSLLDVLEIIPQYISGIVEDFNMNIISNQCLFQIENLKKLAKAYGMKDLYDACSDLDIYIHYFDDMNEIIRLFCIVDIQSYKVLQFIKRLEKVE